MTPTKKKKWSDYEYHKKVKKPILFISCPKKLSSNEFGIKKVTFPPYLIGMRREIIANCLLLDL